MARSNPLHQTRINSLRDSQRMWADTKSQLGDQIYSIGLIRKWYKEYLANVTEGMPYEQARDDAYSVLPVDDPDTESYDESVSSGEFNDWWDRYVGIALAVPFTSEQAEQIDATVAAEIGKLVGLQGLADGEIDAIDGEIKDIEILQQSD